MSFHDLGRPLPRFHLMVVGYRHRALAQNPVGPGLINQLFHGQGAGSDVGDLPPVQNIRQPGILVGVQSDDVGPFGDMVKRAPDNIVGALLDGPMEIVQSSNEADFGTLLP